MSVVVMKFGGTSVGDLDRIRNVARRVRETREEGHEIVVVVSARAGVTNQRIADARALHAHPDPRELDMLMATGEQETIALLSIALQALEVPAVSRTGYQIGVRTDTAHNRARIRSIDGGDIPEQLRKGRVVVVAGFQGITEDGHITTFGRGGSDLSAVALAGAVKAQACRIYTDVDGVYTADPRVVPNARKLDTINYDEMLELASSGSKVMQSRAVEFAKKFSVPFEVRSSFNTNPGTLVTEETSSMEDVVVRGAAMDKNQVKITVSNIPDKPGTAARVFQKLGEANVNVDMIVQNVGREGRANITFTCPIDDNYRAEEAVREVLNSVGGGEVNVADPIAKVSVVGIGMRSHSGVAAKLFTTLAEAGINIQLISTSEIKISVVVSAEQADEAYRVSHDAFDLGEA